MKDGQEERDGLVYGCHVDLFDGDEPDGCVKDYGTDGDCIYAARHRTKWACKYWKPITEAGRKALEDAK